MCSAMGASHASTLSGNTKVKDRGGSSSGTPHGIGCYTSLLSISCSAATICQLTCADCVESEHATSSIGGACVVKNVEEELVTSVPTLLPHGLSSVSTCAAEMDSARSSSASVYSPRLRPYTPRQWESPPHTPRPPSPLPSPISPVPAIQPSSYDSPHLQQPWLTSDPQLQSADLSAGITTSAAPGAAQVEVLLAAKQRKQENSPYRGGVLSLFTPTPPLSPTLPPNYDTISTLNLGTLDGDEVGDRPDGLVESCGSKQAVAKPETEEEKQLREVIERSLTDFHVSHSRDPLEQKVWTKKCTWGSRRVATPGTSRHSEGRLATA